MGGIVKNRYERYLPMLKFFLAGFLCGRFSAACSAESIFPLNDFLKQENRKETMPAINNSTSKMTKKPTTGNFPIEVLRMNEKPPIVVPDLSARTVIVGSMCRCSSGNMVIQYNHSQRFDDTSVIQEASYATGDSKKHFFVRKSSCECRQGKGEKTNDMYFKMIEQRARGGDQKPESKYNNYCPNPHHSNMDWTTMPDFGVEEKLPLFLGVLSYKSPLSLNGSLRNWRSHGLRRLGFAKQFIQLNSRSKQDEEVIARHQEFFNFTVTGTPQENLHPGLAISRFCREAAKMPNSHPNGENLLLFLEKDWHLKKARKDLNDIFRSVNSLVQRGVPYVRLTKSLTEHEKNWQCNAESVSWTCQPAHQHRFTNMPFVIRCDWFLRYMEPFALVEDSIMYGCRRVRKTPRVNCDKRKTQRVHSNFTISTIQGFQNRQYFDWEEAIQDGRVEWINSQWVVASHREDLFQTVEIDK